MGSYFGSIVGATPDPRKLAFRAWKDTLESARLSYCARPGVTQTAYYFSESTGNDANAGTSSSAPKQSIAALNTILAAAPYTDCYLLSGDEWDTNTTVTVASEFTRIQPYGGTGKRPFLNWFTTKITSGWTLVSGTTYSIAQSAAVAWIRATGRGGNSSPMSLTGLGNSSGNNLFCIALAASEAAVEVATIPSWYWVSGTLYINIQSATIPALEISTVSTAATGILLGSTGAQSDVDGIYLRGIRVDGGGLDTTGSAEQFGIMSNASLTAVHCVEDCEAYFSGNHVVGHLNSGSINSGGICVWKDVHAGWGGTGGPTIFVAYGSIGESEDYFVNCHADFGAMNWNNNTFWQQDGWGVAESFYTHTVSSSYNIGLLILDRCHTSTNGQSICPIPFGSSSGIVNGTLSQANAYVVDYTHGEPPANFLPAGNVASGEFGWTHENMWAINTPGAVRINCRGRDVYNSNAGNNYMQFGDAGGWNINCDYEIDAAGPASLSWGGYGGGAMSIQMWNSSMKWNGQVGYPIKFNASAGGQSFVNSIFQSEAANGEVLQPLNLSSFPTGAVQKNCAVFNVSSVTAATGTITLVGPQSRETPMEGNVCYQAGATYPDGVQLEYDIDWNPRNLQTPNIGPREVNPGFTVTQTQTVKFGYETGRTLTFRSYTQGSSPTLVQTISLTESPAGSSNYVTSTALTLGTPITYTITDSVSGVVGQGVM